MSIIFAQNSTRDATFNLNTLGSLKKEPFFAKGTVSIMKFRKKGSKNSCLPTSCLQPSDRRTSCPAAFGHWLTVDGAWVLKAERKVVQIQSDGNKRGVIRAQISPSL